MSPNQQIRESATDDKVDAHCLVLTKKKSLKINGVSIFRNELALLELFGSEFRPLVSELSEMPESLYKLNRSSFTLSVHWVNVRQAEVVLRQLRAALVELNQMLASDKQELKERTRSNVKPSLHFQSRRYAEIRIFPFIAATRVSMLGAKRIDDLMRKRNALKLKIEHEIRNVEEWLRRGDGK